jgi:hypothetical protein
LFELDLVDLLLEAVAGEKDDVEQRVDGRRQERMLCFVTGREGCELVDRAAHLDG